MGATPSVLFVRDYHNLLSMSLTCQEEALRQIERILSREPGPEGAVKRDTSNYWYNQWATLREEIVRFQVLVDRVRRLVDAMRSDAPPPPAVVAPLATWLPLSLSGEKPGRESLAER